MSNLVFDTMIAKESNAQGELLQYARRAVDERDALSKLNADQSQRIADLREDTDLLRRQLYEAQLEHRNDTVTVIKREGGLDYVIAVARVEQTPGNLRVLLV